MPEDKRKVILDFPIPMAPVILEILYVTPPASHLSFLELIAEYPLSVETMRYIFLNRSALVSMSPERVSLVKAMAKMAQEKRGMIITYLPPHEILQALHDIPQERHLEFLEKLVEARGVEYSTSLIEAMKCVFLNCAKERFLEEDPSHKLQRTLAVCTLLMEQPIEELIDAKKRNILHMIATKKFADGFIERYPALKNLIDKKDIYGQTPLDIYLRCNPGNLLGFPQDFLFKVDAALELIFQTLQGNMSDEWLARELFSRIGERYPLYVRGLEERKELLPFVKGAFTFPKRDLLIELMRWEFKMNQALPLTKECLETIQRMLESGYDLVQLRLALQTHPNLEEIELAIAQEPMPLTKQTFFRLPLAKQRLQLLRAVVFRDRGVLSIANHIVKEAAERGNFDSYLLAFSLQVYEKTTIEGASQTFSRLQKLISNKALDPALRGLACRALSHIEVDPTHALRKAFLLDCLKSTEVPELQIALLTALETYIFTADEAERALPDLKTLVNIGDSSVQGALASFLTVLPNEKALYLSLEIVDTSVWDEKERGRDFEGRVALSGDYNLFPYRPAFHDTRYQMHRIIAYRMVELYRSQLEAKAKELFHTGQKSPSLKALEAHLHINDGTRYVPFQIFFPDEALCYRGIQARKGDKLLEAAFVDLLVRGSGSLDLTALTTADDVTWGKVGQSFLSSTADYVFKGYFAQKGILMTVPGKVINEMMLRRKVRYQKEGSLHAVFYSRIAHHQIAHLFMSDSEHQPYIEALLQTPLQTPSTLRKATQRALERGRETLGRPLKERIAFYDSKTDLNAQRFLKTHRLTQTSYEEIVATTLQRHIMLELLAQNYPQPQMQALLQEGTQVPPYSTW